MDLGQSAVAPAGDGVEGANVVTGRPEASNPDEDFT